MAIRGRTGILPFVAALGGGRWASFLGRGNTSSVSYARGGEGGGFYFRSGLLF